MYKVIGTRKTRALRVLWMLEELGVAYEHDPCMPRSAEARAANPSGKVPSLLVDGKAMIDSMAILTFLADRHDGLTHPAGSVERGQQDALTFTILDEIDAALWTAAKHSFILPEDRRVPAVKDTLKWEFESSLSRIADACVGPFLMGDKMTIPDILLVHCLRWADSAGFPSPAPALIEYQQHLQARPAFQRVLELP